MGQNSIENIKHCNGCDQDLPLEEFHRDRTSPSGLHARCKTCKNRWRSEHRPAKPRNRVKSTVSASSARIVKESLFLGKNRSMSPTSSDDIDKEANRLALIQLVKNHRSEFDSMAYRMKMSLRYMPEGISRELNT